MNNHPSDELKSHLLEYQTALIRNVNQRRKTPVSLHNAKDIKMLNDIWEAAQVDGIQVTGARKWKKLGFSVSVRLFMQSDCHCSYLSFPVGVTPT